MQEKNMTRDEYKQMLENMYKVQGGVDGHAPTRSVARADGKRIKLGVGATSLPRGVAGSNPAPAPKLSFELIIVGQMQHFFVPGPLPGMNEFAGKKSRWHYRELKANWGEAIGVQIGMAKLKPMQRASVLFRWQEKHNRRDPDNIMVGAKFILDALVARKILPDDGWAEIAALTHTFSIDKKRPGVWVELTEAV
jgi:Holliday junction resolvase RusA-like endonuclease